MKHYRGRVIICRVDKIFSFPAEDDVGAKASFELLINKAIAENTVVIEIEEVKNV